MLITAIPTYNSLRWLPFTLSSILFQTRLPNVIIISDNYSSDGTWEYLQKWRDRHNYLPRVSIILHQQEFNLGMVGNFNRLLDYAHGIENASGKPRYLHLMTSDDILDPRFYEKSLDALWGLPPGSLSYTLIQTINEWGNITKKESQVLPSDKPREISLNDFLSRHAELNPVCLPSCILKLGHPKTTRFRLGCAEQVADIAFLAAWPQKSQETSIIEIPQILFSYRFHRNNLSTRNTRNIQLWVLDEWAAINLISSWIDEPWWQMLVRYNRLACLFSARCYDKIDRVRPTDPSYAIQIEDTLRDLIQNPLHRWLGWLAYKTQGLWRRKKSIL